MAIPLEASIVRIFASDGGVVGTGFLVGEMSVLTCAHVVAAALSVTTEEPIPPDCPISLDFPLVAPGAVLSAHVTFWESIQSDGSGDIAVLRLEHDPPNEAKVARLVTAEDLWEHPFRVFGFPRNHDQGVWSSGKLRAREATGWIQIEDVKTIGKSVQQGFSGGGVWDEQLEGIVGMVVAADDDASKVAYMIPTKLLVQVWPQLGQQTIPPCPYRGLFAFREQDATYFFGREALTQQLVDVIRTKSLVAVIGPSGSGKSSLVFAGLIPQLNHEGTWLIVSYRPGNDLFRNLATSLIPLLELKMSETDRLLEIKKLTERFEQGTVSLYDVVCRLQQIYSVTHVLVVIDQFEEIYTAYKKEQQTRYFLSTLLASTASKSHDALCDIHILLTLRADFFGHALSYRPFADVLQNADIKLGPMMRQELEEAIKKPAQKLHVQVEDGLTERLLDDVGSSPGNLPLLEFALSLLWTRQRAGTLTHTAYDEIGGVKQALALYAEEIYQKLEEEEQKQVQYIFMQLVQPGEGTEDVRRLANRAEIGEERWGIVIRLSDARLVVTGRNEATEQDTVEVVHEALIREWKRLHSWIEANREFRLWQERMRGLIRQWATSNQEKDLLLRGTSLEEAERWLFQYSEALSEHEKAFINQSKTERQKQEAAEWVRQLREKKELAAKRQAVKWLRFAVIALSIFLIIVVVLTSMIGILFRQTNDALQVANLQKQIALSRALAAQANSYLVKNQIDLSLLLSMRAYQTNNNYESRDSLLSALEFSSRFSTVLSGGGGFNSPNYISGLAFSPDGRTLLSSDGIVFDAGDGVSSDSGDSLVNRFIGRVSSAPSRPYSGITLWNMKTRQPHNLLLSLKYTENPNYVAFSPDGMTFASTGGAGILLWSSKTGEPVAQFNVSDFVTDFTFSPNGKFLAASDCGKYADLFCSLGHILIWDLTTQKLVKSLVTNQIWDINHLSFSPDGKLLASGGCYGSYKRATEIDVCVKGRILLWDMLTGQLAGPPLEGSQQARGEVKFSPNGKLLAACNDDGTIAFWDVSSRKLLDPPLPGNTGGVSSIAFNADGSILASGGRDGVVRLWDVTKRTLIGDPLIGHPGYGIKVAWSSDGQLASGDNTGAIILWNVNNVENAFLDGQILQDKQALASAAFSPDGKYLATGDSDGKIVVRDGASLTYIATLSTPANYLGTQKGISNDIDSLAFSADGRILASHITSGPILLWDLMKRKVIAQLADNAKYQSVIAFSPNSRTLAATDENGIINLWDLTTLQVVKRLVYSFHGSNTTVTKLTFSPDGHILAARYIYSVITNTSNQAFILWDVVTSRPIGQPSIVADLTFSPDGHTIASLSEDGTIVFSEISSRKIINQFNAADGNEFYRSIVFSPDGKVVAVSSENGNPYQSTVTLWIVATHEHFIHPLQYGNWADLYISPNGRWLVTTNSYGLLVSDISPSSWQENACRIANRNFTLDEWREYVSDEPYQKVCKNLPVNESEIKYMLVQARSAAVSGDNNSASRAYTQASQWAIQTSDAIINWYICRYGSIDQLAKQVLPSCEHAIELEPNNGIYYDSRGLARALTGDTQGAIEDFQFFLAWATKVNLYPGKPYLAERKAWINELEAEHNPFDTNTLKAQLEE